MAEPTLSIERWAHLSAGELPIFTCLQFDANGRTRIIEDEDERERDLQLRRLALEVVIQHAVWLMPLLELSGAVLAAVPGHLFYVLPPHHPTLPGGWIELPDLDKYMALTPWTERGEAPH